MKLGASVTSPCPFWGYLGANLRVAMPLFSRLFLLGATDSGTCELVWTVCVSEHVRAPADSCLCNCCIIRLGVLRCLGGSRCDRGCLLRVRICRTLSPCLFPVFRVRMFRMEPGALACCRYSICPRLVNFYQCPVNPSKFIYFQSVEPSSSSCR